MSQGPEDALVKLYKENEIEESQFNDTWLQNKNDIENFIYKKELDINTLNNYSQNLITLIAHQLLFLSSNTSPSPPPPKNRPKLNLEWNSCIVLTDFNS